MLSAADGFTAVEMPANFDNLNRWWTLHKRCLFFNNKSIWPAKDDIILKRWFSYSAAERSGSRGSGAVLKPQQNVFQPVEFEIAENERAVSEQQHPENRRPFPAKHPFFAAFEQKCRGKNVSAQRERQTPEREQLQFRRRDDLNIPELRARDRRNADDDDNQQREIDALDQESLHGFAGARVARPQVHRFAPRGQAGCALFN